MPTKKTKAQLEASLSITNDALEAALAASAERDNNFFTGGLSELYSDRSSWDRKKVFAESLRAWRVNPMARRIVTLISSFVVGKGLTITCTDNPQADKFLKEWWNHPLNRIGRNTKRWKDEDTRTGNLFFLCSVVDGMTFVRAMPADQIEEIKSKENDIEQETFYYTDPNLTEGHPAYEPGQEQTSFMLHFASNKPVGSAWGEADLSPLLVWIGRYSSWLEDRVRLNKFRTAFLFVVSGSYNNEADRKARQIDLQSKPPQPGSILVLNRNNGEDWGILGANLDSFDASVDGLAIKKMFAGGVGFPLHWLAEPESATRTTAEAAGTPSFRTLEEAQSDFFHTLTTLARTALEVKGLPTDVDIQILGPDITERDNASLALALGRAYPQLADMFDRELIDEKQLLDVSFRMMAEPFDGKAPKGKRKPLVQPTAQAPGQSEPTDPKTDENDPQEGE